MENTPRKFPDTSSAERLDRFCDMCLSYCKITLSCFTSYSLPFLPLAFELELFFKIYSHQYFQSQMRHYVCTLCPPQYIRAARAFVSLLLQLQQHHRVHRVLIIFCSPYAEIIPLAVLFSCTTVDICAKPAPAWPTTAMRMAKPPNPRCAVDKAATKSHFPLNTECNASTRPSSLARFTYESRGI